MTERPGVAHSFGRLLAMVLALGAVLLLGSGCASYRVVYQAEPNPFIGRTSFHIAGIDYTNLMVGDETEAGFKAGRDADGNRAWDEDKQIVSDTFAKTLIDELDGLGFGPPGPNVVEIHAHVSEMHGGISMGIASTAARIEMQLVLVIAGQALDEITLSASTSQGEGFSIAGIATSGYTGRDRLRQTAEKLGEWAADYIESRVSP